ncbi:hypothetical protein DM01DRAFT_1332184 [Hesseltinella vesiculosa]|uniref:Uncharacterized protein n=1 Tax=Hesseltinella vesiculosa TaxID=101127 RepID=A0A1X2GUC5_9FUNG|nr:hypothetical protein DM01DRAFT_1332184 [Hesseltinella vesiculosa]
MLDNKQLLATLPDKGARLKEKLAQLNALLKPGYTPEDTEKVVDQVSNLSLKDKYRRNMRKKSIDEHSATANQLHHLLQPGSTVPGGMMARSKMISLSESVHLQETLTKQEKELSLKKQMQQIKVTGPEAMDTDDLTSTLGRMQIQGLTHHEYDDDTDTEDEDEHDYEQSYEDDSFHQLDSAYEEGENDDDR